MHAIRLAVHPRVARQEPNQLFHINYHRAQIVKSILQFFQNLRLSIGRRYSSKKIYFAQRQRITHNRILAILQIMRLVSISVKYVISLVHGISQQAQLLQHSLVCDVPSSGLVNDDLCPKENPFEAVLNIRHLLLGAFADEETYGSSDRLTKQCRNYHVHFRTLEDRTVGGAAKRRKSVLLEE
jgi:hypothetical protein